MAPIGLDAAERWQAQSLRYQLESQTTDVQEPAVAEIVLQWELRYGPYRSAGGPWLLRPPYHSTAMQHAS